MATLKEMIAEIFNSEFSEIDEGQPANPTGSEQSAGDSEALTVEDTPTEMTEEDIRKYIQEEVTALYNEAKQAKARTMPTKIVDNQPTPERTVDDILADRFKSVMGTQSKGE